MNDVDLIAALARLGIDKENYRIITLLPLIQVAWADGRVQRAEKDIILRKAVQYQIPDSGRKILDQLLQSKPPPEYFEQARAALLALVNRQGSGMEVDTQVTIIEMCENVARSAGGLFGVFDTVDERERVVIREVAEAMLVGVNINWNAVFYSGAPLDQKSG